jgi:hypothetical protein
LGRSSSTVRTPARVSGAKVRKRAGTGSAMQIAASLDCSRNNKHVRRVGRRGKQQTGIIPDNPA